MERFPSKGRNDNSVVVALSERGEEGKGIPNLKMAGVADQMWPMPRVQEVRWGMYR